MNHLTRVFFVLLVLVGVYWLWQDAEEPVEAPSTEFVSEGGVILRVTSPLKEALVISPLMLTGEAPGTWYFEASFPIVLVDWDGRIIAQGHAEAQADWMTEILVPFVATLEFTKPDYGTTGALILQRDNPSGLLENDDAVEVPIRFE